MKSCTNIETITQLTSHFDLRKISSGVVNEGRGGRKAAVTKCQCATYSGATI